MNCCRDNSPRHCSLGLLGVLLSHCARPTHKSGLFGNNASISISAWDSRGEFNATGDLARNSSAVGPLPAICAILILFGGGHGRYCSGFSSRVWSRSLRLSGLLFSTASLISRCGTTRPQFELADSISAIISLLSVKHSW